MRLPQRLGLRPFWNDLLRSAPFLLSPEQVLRIYFSGTRFLLALVALAFISAPPARAAGVVSTCDQTHLQAALTGGGAVTFSCSGTITLTSTSTISANTSIDGTGQTVTISGGGSVQVFSLNNLTIANGNSVYGAGLFNEGGTVDVTNTTFSGNTGQVGGAIFNEIGTMRVTSSTFSGNTAVGSGGSGFGAAIVNFATLAVINSTFSGNTASNYGGGLYTQNNNGGTLTVTNSTFSGNTAPAGHGGAITNCLGACGGRMTLQNNIVANSTSSGDCLGTITDGGYNLADDATCAFSATGSANSVTTGSLNLGALASNGGPTQTIALLTGSMAIDAIPVGTNGCGTTITTDQRGVTRPQGSACDIGAYELNAVTPVTSPCGPSNPAPISGSTGAQGILDPANTNSALGLVWPTGTINANIAMDTGQVSFQGAGGSLGSATLPGAVGTPAFPDGKLNFTSVHLPAGATLDFSTSINGLPPPVILLSCQDVVLDPSSTLAVSTTSQNGPLPGAFSGAGAPNRLAGFGPRVGSLPAAASLYPAIGGAGGHGNGTAAGGSGGPAFVIAAAQRVTLNGTVDAAGIASKSSLTIPGTGFNSFGSPLAPGSIDASWKIGNNPFGGNQAFFTTPVNPDWFGGWVPNSNVATFRGSGWITDNASTNNDGPAPYTFSTTFDLSSFVLSSVSISGQWTIDDAGTLDINGHNVATLDSAWGSMHNFSITDTSVLNQGLNTISMTLTRSDNNFEGARFEGSAVGTLSSTAQGGGGGSVRLSGLLVEGIGTVNTSGGSDSDGVVRSPAGPVEVQAFLQDLFAGATTTTPIRGNLPVQAVPANLPVIAIAQVNAGPYTPPFQQFGFGNTGSLTTPDVTFPQPSAATITVDVSISTQHVPDGTILAFQAVGMDGSAVSANASVSQAAAVAHLTLNAGTTYQIVVTPGNAFALSRRNPNAVASTGTMDRAGAVPLMAGTAKNSPGTQNIKSLEREGEIAEQWMKAFGMTTEMVEIGRTEVSHEQLAVAVQ